MGKHSGGCCVSFFCWLFVCVWSRNEDIEGAKLCVLSTDTSLRVTFRMYSVGFLVIRSMADQHGFSQILLAYICTYAGSCVPWQFMYTLTDAVVESTVFSGHHYSLLVLFCFLNA